MRQFSLGKTQVEPEEEGNDLRDSEGSCQYSPPPYRFRAFQLCAMSSLVVLWACAIYAVHLPFITDQRLCDVGISGEYNFPPA